MNNWIHENYSPNCTVHTRCITVQYILVCAHKPGIPLHGCSIFVSFTVELVCLIFCRQGTFWQIPNTQSCPSPFPPLDRWSERRPWPRHRMQNSVWNVNEKPRIGGAAHVQDIGSDPTDPSGTFFIFFYIFKERGLRIRAVQMIRRKGIL